MDLLGEGIDLAVRMGTLPDDALLAARRIAELSIGLYAAPAYLAEHGDPTTPDELGQHQTLRMRGLSGEPVDWRLIRGVENWQGPLQGRVTANAPEFLLRLARAGAGIAAIPDCFATADLHQGRLRHVLPDWHLPIHPAWAVFPGRRLMPAKTRAFITLLETALATPSRPIGPSPLVKLNPHIDATRI